jgi:hypothetical protein
MAAIGLAVPGAARGGPSLSLNGVPIDGAVGQRIENATVVIDEQGNVNILAQGYAVERPASEARPLPSGPAAGERLSRRYFAVAYQPDPGAAAYDVAIFLNGRWVREVRSDGDAAPFEVTRFLSAGPNRVQLVATKRLAGARRTSSREATLRVVIGEGHLDGGAVLVDAPLVEMTRNAAEVDTVTEEHTLVAR